MEGEREGGKEGRRGRERKLTCSPRKLPLTSRNTGPISQGSLVLDHLHFLLFENVLRLSTQLPKVWKYFCCLEVPH